MASAFGRMSGSTPELASLTIQSIAVGHRFEFHANGVGDGDDGSSLECESRHQVIMYCIPLTSSFTRSRVAGLVVSKVNAHRHTRVERYREESGGILLDVLRPWLCLDTRVRPLVQVWLL